MSELIDNLRKLCNEHEKHIIELRDKISDIEYVPRAKALVGKCFKFASSTGLNNRKCWTYKKVIRSKRERLFVDSFHEDPYYSKIEFHYGESESVLYFANRSWTEISEKEFLKAHQKLINKIIKNGKKRG